jgi:hypothetical protein
MDTAAAQVCGRLPRSEVLVLIGSYNTNYSRRQLWINAAAFSAFCIGGPVYFLTAQGPNRAAVNAF